MMMDGGDDDWNGGDVGIRECDILDVLMEVRVGRCPMLKLRSTYKILEQHDHTLYGS